MVGANTAAGFLPALSGMTLQIVERGGETFLPPFDDITLAPGDRLFVAATRKEISDALASKDHPLSHQLLPLVPDIEADSEDETILAELVVAPGSRMAARAVHQTGFTHDTGCFIIGVQRRRRMLRHELTENRLEAGDVLLVIGRQANIESLRDNRDTLLMEWSARELPRFEKAQPARLIFAATVLSAATGLVPIVAASVTGATLMVVSGVLNVRQASRGFDLRIFLVVAAALAMSHALFVSGGANFIAAQLLYLFDGHAPAVILSAFFLLCAVVTNILSNNATAVLFTPLAVNLAGSLNVDPLAFILAVLFA
ncbi:MAG: SLC13 family permease, partial [Pseudomonadota bacterium]|nr:SLC13 family permease [Pseudomonadota bacterium]